MNKRYPRPDDVISRFKAICETSPNDIERYLCQTSQRVAQWKGRGISNVFNIAFCEMITLSDPTGCVVYAIEFNGDMEFVKIGSTSNYKQRYRSIKRECTRIANSRPGKLLMAMRFSNDCESQYVESVMQNVASNDRISGDYFEDSFGVAKALLYWFTAYQIEVQTLKV